MDARGNQGLKSCGLEGGVWFKSLKGSRELQGFKGFRELAEGFFFGGGGGGVKVAIIIYLLFCCFFFQGGGGGGGGGQGSCEFKGTDGGFRGRGWGCTGVWGLLGEWLCLEP